MKAIRDWCIDAARRALRAADARMNGLYGWRLNPLYHSGAIVVVLLLTVLVTGVYLLFFYKIGSPYLSVERIAAQAWLGRWIRTLHRYASDAVVVAALVHLLRTFVQHRTWGPRALAWISGLVLLFVILICGWTGYVMVWDTQGIVLAKAGARLLDWLPIFSEPVSRAFAGDRDIPSAFFFLNLFLHVALPVGMGVLLWLHVSRVARPALMPPRGLSVGVTGLLLAVSVAWPASLGPAADLLTVPGRAPYDAFYAAWLPLVWLASPGLLWAGGSLATIVLVLVPWWNRPRDPLYTRPSRVNQRLCDACEQCYLDCPYEAISMVERDDGREGLVSSIDSTRCVSCGICAGSCAPMGIGPPQRTGRDQLAAVTAFIETHGVAGRDVVLVGCARSGGAAHEVARVADVPVYETDCAGSIHTSVVEYLVRSGVGGVLIVACPPRDCWSREGPKWLDQRLYHDREAELKARVDRRRVWVLHAGFGERRAVFRTLRTMADDVARLAPRTGEARIDIDTACETAEGRERAS